MRIKNTSPSRTIIIQLYEKTYTFTPGLEIYMPDAFFHDVQPVIAPYQELKIQSLNASAGNAPSNSDSLEEQLVLIEDLQDQINNLSSGDEITITLSPAQILALDVTPVELIPSPGAGKVILLDTVELFLDFNTTAYSTSGGQIRISYASHGIPASGDINGFLDATADAYRIRHSMSTNFSIAAPNNQAVSILLTDPVTLGDSPVKVRVKYKVVTLLT